MSDSLWPPQTIAHQAPLSMGILQGRILEWVACLPPGIFPIQEPVSLTSPALTDGFFTTSATWETLYRLYRTVRHLPKFRTMGDREEGVPIPHFLTLTLWFLIINIYFVFVHVSGTDPLNPWHFPRDKSHEDVFSDFWTALKRGGGLPGEPSVIRRLKLLVPPPWPQGNWERLEVESLTNGQWCNQSRLHNEASIDAQKNSFQRALRLVNTCCCRERTTRKGHGSSKSLPHTLSCARSPPGYSWYFL